MTTESPKEVAELIEHRKNRRATTGELAVAHRAELAALQGDKEVVGETKEPIRFRVYAHPNCYYTVSIPRYQGGAVVKAEAFDAVVSALREAHTWIAGLALMHSFNGQRELLSKIDDALKSAGEEV